MWKRTPRAKPKDFSESSSSDPSDSIRDDGHDVPERTGSRSRLRYLPCADWAAADAALAHLLFDLVYWAGSTLFVFRMLYYSNQGDLRFYVFLGLAVGVTFHYWFLSRPVIRLVLLLIKLVRWLARMIRRTFELLVVKPIILLYRLVKILAGFVLVLAVFLYRIVIQLLYPIWKLLRWMTSPLWKRLSWPLWMKRWLTRSREWVAGMIRSLFK
ncbi:spore cortex biosynthesis protein YabQ [Paenibacillus sp. CC-CFT747]|nr:spore cortex biosynthesis protein YabQ [Paenibacillus sp. CC-CFT747]